MHTTSALCLLLSTVFASAEVQRRQQDTSDIITGGITSEHGYTIISNGPGFVTNSASVTGLTNPFYTPAPGEVGSGNIIIDGSTTITQGMATTTRPPGAESSVAIIIDGSTMYEPGMNTGGVSVTAGTSTSGGFAGRVTQAPVLAGGVAALAWMAM